MTLTYKSKRKELIISLNYLYTAIPCVCKFFAAERASCKMTPAETTTIRSASEWSTVFDYPTANYSSLS
jgi:hypothetical protein